MKNLPILITGCQRSGTTLLNLVLDSHPEIHGIDEMEFRNENLRLYLNHANYYPNVSFKLPAFSSAVDSFSRIPNMKVLWCIRDYRDVVSSMVKLKLNLNGELVPWVIHPLGAKREIANSEIALKGTINDELRHLFMRYYQMITPPTKSKYSREELVFIGALCWRLKQQLLALYDSRKINYRIVRYEEVVKNPKEEINKILSFLNIQWNDNVLKHHEFHAGFSVGNTDNTKPIDSSNTGQWRKNLSSQEVAVIDEVCLKTAKNFSYA